MLWLYLYFPSLQLDQLIDNGEQQRQQVIAIVDARRNEIIQINEPAKQAGLSCGMGLATASALCHSLTVLPYQEELEFKQLTFIAECLYRFVADIALDRPNGLFLKIDNMLALYRDVGVLWQKIHQLLAGMNVHVHYATAITPLAAKLLAQAHVDKITTEENIVDQLLATLPIERVFKSTQHQTQLRRLGIKTFAQLDSLPTKALAARVDNTFIYYWQQIKGSIPLKLSFYQPKLKFYQYIELLYEIKEVTVLIRPLTKVIAKLSHFLRVRNLATQSILLTLIQRECKPLSIFIESAAPEDDQHKWLNLINLHLERQPLKAPVTALTIEVAHFVEKKLPVYDFFEQKVNDQLSFEELTGLLTAKLGKSKVFRPILLSDHRPELASQLVLTSASFASEERDVARLRPSYLLSSPQPLIEQVVITQGPERIESGWWQQPIIRDYYVGYNEQGQWCWLFRRQDSRWFVHGYFA
ncbi:Y-family DNA polymerase [Thalassotalea ganghwensis]